MSRVGISVGRRIRETVLGKIVLVFGVTMWGHSRSWQEMLQSTRQPGSRERWKGG